MKNGFSLAEVLVTLMIIGVIAGMTIPSLRKDSVNKTVSTTLKKVYSELNQSYNLFLQENYSSKLCRTHVLDDDVKFEADFIYSKFSVMLACDAGAPEKCFGNDSVIGSRKSYLLTNGVALAFDTLRQGWCPNLWGNIYVDVNGPKSPNKGGVDQFVLNVNNSGLVQTSYSINHSSYVNYARETCSSGSDYNAAWACAVLIQADGWEIKY